MTSMYKIIMFLHCIDWYCNLRLSLTKYFHTGVVSEWHFCLLTYFLLCRSLYRHPMYHFFRSWEWILFSSSTHHYTLHIHEFIVFTKYVYFILRWVKKTITTTTTCLCEFLKRLGILSSNYVVYTTDCVPYLKDFWYQRLSLTQIN